jgi:hypothetical protein
MKVVSRKRRRKMGRQFARSKGFENYQALFHDLVLKDFAARVDALIKHDIENSIHTI